MNIRINGTPSRRRHHLTTVIATGSLFLFAVFGTGSALAEMASTHTDVEFRLGAGETCGICDHRHGASSKIRPTVQLFVDRLFAIAPIGSGTLEIGPYVKGALLDGVAVPQIAGGGLLGYRIGNYEVLVNGGLAYATERIGESASELGQTKHTYDLGLALRYDFAQHFVSVGYQHNSNGNELGINTIHGKGSNHGYDNIFIGVGIRF